MTDNFWLDRRVFVTGGTGLIGTHLVDSLVSKGADVVCLVRDNTPSSLFFQKNLQWDTTVVFGEIEDQRLLDRLVDEYEINTVFHLAAQTIVGTANVNPLATFEANIRGTYNLLEACRGKSKIRSVICASSDKAYGSTEQLPYTESARLEGRAPYDCSKSCSDLIARSYYESFSVPVNVTRCGNIYGPGDLNWNRIVPGTVRSILRGQPIAIRTDGTMVRDYFYVRDAADAYTELAEHLGLSGNAYNFSYGLPITSKELICTIAKMMGAPDHPVKILNQMSNEIPAQHLDCTAARTDLGWQPSVGMEEGLRETIQWYKELLS